MRRPELECWPDLRVTLHLPPWGWRIKPWLYVDGNGARSHWSAAWLFLVVEWWGQDPGHPMFPMRDEMAHLLGDGRGIDLDAQRPSTESLLVGEPILIRCEGSNCPPAGRVIRPVIVPGLPNTDTAQTSTVTVDGGLCAMCGQHVVLLSGIVPEHQRDDIIARVKRGDFDRRIELLEQSRSGSPATEEGPTDGG